MVRDYASPDPAGVVRSCRAVLSTGDMQELTKGAYQFLTTHCGFIAHYDHAGFISTYQHDLPSFVDLFLSPMGLGWDVWLDNPKSYLYDVRYKGRFLADIVRELIPLFQAFRPAVLAAHEDSERAHKMGLLRWLADDLGYTVVTKAVFS